MRLHLHMPEKIQLKRSKYIFLTNSCIIQVLLITESDYSLVHICVTWFETDLVFDWSMVFRVNATINWWGVDANPVGGGWILHVLPGDCHPLTWLLQEGRVHLQWDTVIWREGCTAKHLLKTLRRIVTSTCSWWQWVFSLLFGLGRGVLDLKKGWDEWWGRRKGMNVQCHRTESTVNHGCQSKCNSHCTWCIYSIVDSSG